MKMNFRGELIVIILDLFNYTVLETQLSNYTDDLIHIINILKIRLYNGYDIKDLKKKGGARKIRHA